METINCPPLINLNLFTKLVSAQEEEGPGHLLNVVSTARVEDVTHLELLQRLLNLPLLPQNQT